MTETKTKPTCDSHLCGAESPNGSICAKGKWHEGDHVAFGSESDHVARWPSDAEAFAETARKAAAYDGLTARVAELEAELGRYSMCAGRADQFRGEALACRKALGFPVDGEGDDAASPHDITIRIAALGAELASATSAYSDICQILDSDLPRVERVTPAGHAVAKALVGGLASERDAATARAEALGKTLRRFLPESHYGFGPEMADCSDACVFDGDDECDPHRPDIGADECNAHPRLDERDAVCDRCLILTSLESTPPTDPTPSEAK